MDQKMMKIFGAVIAGFMLLILILFFISNCSIKKKTYTYNMLEDKMISVAKDYYKENSKELPSKDGETVTYTLEKMLNDQKISDLNSLFKKEVKCEGSVTVRNNNGFYLYSPYLSCNNEYTTNYLKDKIIKDATTTAGAGLYNYKDQYIFKGEVNNNYVSFNKELYRIIRINKDGTIRLLQLTGINQVLWDDRYNSNALYTSGLNEYTYNSLDSRMKERLDDTYKNETKWPESAKKYIVLQDICVGKRSRVDTTKDGQTECSKVVKDQHLSLISVYEYLQASLDKNCKSTTDKNCVNYNWLSKINNNMWTITASSESTNEVYAIYQNPVPIICSNLANANVVINITDKAIYAGGDGTKENPYTFK